MISSRSGGHHCGGNVCRLSLKNVLLFLVLTASSVQAEAAGRRRALLVGINDYTASRLTTRSRIPAAPGRDWPNLRGAATDAHAMAEMLVLLYGFDPKDVVELTDQSATREAILRALEQHLLQPAAKDDVLFFYFGGHGSQVWNSRSMEADKLDESIVPADSRLGARDIRDKELRSIFNRILDRGARLTILLDDCHSGSGARGLSSGTQPRGVKVDMRDIADAIDHGPLPEKRGALVLSATSDAEPAWETRDEEGRFHGAFTWAWMRALRDSSPGEPAEETFARAEARLRAETPYQEPVISGNAPERLSPFLGVRGDRHDGRTVVAVENVRSDGTVVLRGGWANGLAVGTELRVISEVRTTAKIIVTAIYGLARSEGRVESGRILPLAVRSGALLEIVGWVAPPGRPLRVWAPRTATDANAIAAVARLLLDAANRRGLRWITDPTEVTPANLLRRRGAEWELLTHERIERISSDAAAIAAIARLPRSSSLFVQFAGPSAVVEALGIGPGSAAEAVDPVEEPDDADYILTGRFVGRQLSYAWVRPLVKQSDRRKTGLPVSTTWIPADARASSQRDCAAALREAVLRIRRIHAWSLLESPPDFRFAYQLALRRQDGVLIAKKYAPLIGNERYKVVVRTPSPAPKHVPQRSLYVFVIDSHGRSTLLFPDKGSIENRLPLPPGPAQPPPYPPIEIPLGSLLEITEPYGVDTYFLLSTDEPLPNPWILEWDGVGARDVQAQTELEQYLMLVDSDSRVPVRRITAPTWSIERVPFEAVAPRAHAVRR
jgi:uncharacterized caspase-like protein